MAASDTWYWFVRNLVRVVYFRGTGGLTILGLENVPLEGPLIVAPNHVSELDPPAIACTIPRKIAFMSKEELFRNRLLGGLIRSLNAFPVRRGEGDTEAIRKTLAKLAEGEAVLVFPEGTRGDGVTMGPITRGVGMLAKRSGAPVLPVGIAGTHRKFPRGKSVPGWGRTTVAFGKPLRFEDYGRETFADALAEAVRQQCGYAGLELKAARAEPSSTGFDRAAEASER